MDVYKYTLKTAPRHYDFFIASETPEQACKTLELSAQEFAEGCETITGKIAELLGNKHPNQVFYREQGQQQLHALAEGENLITFHLNCILGDVSIA